MFGGSEPETAGIIPRATRHIFDHIGSSTEAREWSIKASFLEIYRETLRGKVASTSLSFFVIHAQCLDLLNPGNSSKLQIREQKKKIWVENLSEEYVGAPEDVMELISAGEKLRATSATGMNETSSRSHSVFILKIESKPEAAGGAAARSAVLNLIDLAGSERVGKTGATGQTLKEAQKINQSLSALGNVISALSSGTADHVPYRDSQLTRLLQESLGGNCKTRLVIACSPHCFNYEETLSSLRFGQRAKTLKNKIHKNEERSVEELKALIKALRGEVEEWKSYAAKLKAGNAAAEPPKSAATVVADVEAAKKNEDNIALELDKSQEAVAALRAQLEERQMEAESAAAKLAHLEQELKEKEAQAEAAEREGALRVQRLESELENAMMRLRLEHCTSLGKEAAVGKAAEEKAGLSAADEAVFLAEIAALSEKLGAARSQGREAELEKRHLESKCEGLMREVAEQRERLEDSASRQELEEARRELAELLVWKSTQETRKARVFRPLKSGAKGPPQAFAEKLDHTELRKGLKSVSVEKKLW